jgi:hypothetical protein
MTSPSFPGALDALANPGPTTETDDAGFELDIVVSRLQNCIMAIEPKLGIGASTPGATAAVLRRTASGTSAWDLIRSGDFGPGVIAGADVGASQIGPAQLAASPVCQVTLSTLGSIPNNSSTVYPFDTELLDNDSMHSTSVNTSRITMSTAGLYLIFGQMQWPSNTAGFRQTQIKLNGTTFIGETTGPPANGAQTIQQTFALGNFAVGHYVEYVVGQSSGGSLSIPVSSVFFSAVWLGKLS